MVDPEIICLRECYKQLPEANTVPDEVGTCEALQEAIERLKEELARLRGDLDIEYPRLLQVLRKSWTKEEIKEAGF